ncbi:DUF434 domain-containing protein [Roseimaritima sediminicola]|uniref:DUF434 domain-containing protein n=1 Tax=Roseimaritima sediminicola TaxID=2662066 RepID=UPI00138709A0|nr:DUF434 domain-containing protein [Roseimaritima sediminicola]
MPDHRKHRGPHPYDRRLFGDDVLARLSHAVEDLSWLLSRRYAAASALKLVGDRYALRTRQRVAVGRCSCSDGDATRRKQHQVSVHNLPGNALWIDGFNVLTTLEAALSGGVILQARDGCFRDMASMHGSYRRVEETARAIQILGERLAAWKVSSCRWLLDRPVSNSGRLKTMLRETVRQHGWDWEVELVPDPDAVLVKAPQVVASADSQILDRAAKWFNLARGAVESKVQDAWVVRPTSRE